MPAVIHAPRPYTIPKPGGGIRHMAQLAPPDAARWLELARAYASTIERSLGPEVLGSRWSPAGTTPLRPALRRARHQARALARRSSRILRTDVRDFYASVEPEIVADSLRRVGVSAREGVRAASMVEGWRHHGVLGLPIGPEASALFANAVLAPVDSTLRSLGFAFVRWVDDYLIGLGDQDPGPLLDAIDAALHAQGLERNLHKTAVEEPVRSLSGTERGSWASAMAPFGGEGGEDRVVHRVFHTMSP